jgi:hypothetical protein
MRGITILVVERFACSCVGYTKEEQKSQGLKLERHQAKENSPTKSA